MSEHLLWKWEFAFYLRNDAIGSLFFLTPLLEKRAIYSLVENVLPVYVHNCVPLRAKQSLEVFEWMPFDNA